MNSRFWVCPLAVFGGGLGHGLLAGNGGVINAAAYGKTPLTFEWRGAEADGQPFVPHVSGHTMAFAASGAVIERPGPGGPHQPETMLRFVGARPCLRRRS